MGINSERSKEIRERIKKELGYNSRQVGVRSGDCGYSDYTRITVKDLSCDFEAIEKIAKTFQSIRYDEYNGEILSGANTYINVEYDWEILNEAEKTELENAEKALKEADAGNQTFFTDKKETRYVIIPTMQRRYDRNGEIKDCREYVVAAFKKDKGYGDNLSHPGSFEQVKWTVARILAIEKARAA